MVRRKTNRMSKRRKKLKDHQKCNERGKAQDPNDFHDSNDDDHSVALSTVGSETDSSTVPSDAPTSALLSVYATELVNQSFNICQDIRRAKKANSSAQMDDTVSQQDPQALTATPADPEKKQTKSKKHRKNALENFKNFFLDAQFNPFDETMSAPFLAIPKGVARMKKRTKQHRRRSDQLNIDLEALDKQLMQLCMQSATSGPPDQNESSSLNTPDRLALAGLRGKGGLYIPHAIHEFDATFRAVERQAGKKKPFTAPSKNGLIPIPVCRPSIEGEDALVYVETVSEEEPVVPFTYFRSARPTEEYLALRAAQVREYNYAGNDMEKTIREQLIVRRMAIGEGMVHIPFPKEPK